MDFSTFLVRPEVATSIKDSGEIQHCLSQLALAKEAISAIFGDKVSLDYDLLDNLHDDLIRANALLIKADAVLQNALADFDFKVLNARAQKVTHIARSSWKATEMCYGVRTARIVIDIATMALILKLDLAQIIIEVDPSKMSEIYNKIPFDLDKANLALILDHYYDSKDSIRDLVKRVDYTEVFTAVMSYPNTSLIPYIFRRDLFTGNSVIESLELAEMLCNMIIEWANK